MPIIEILSKLRFHLKGSNLFIEGNYRNVGDVTVSGVQYKDISTLGLNAGIKFTF